MLRLPFPDVRGRGEEAVQKNLEKISLEWTDLKGRLFWGTGSPESAVTATVGALYLRTDGGTGTTLYVKESGTGNTGWVAK